jgi:C-terminal processing protease CtpA/Prc
MSPKRLLPLTLVIILALFGCGVFSPAADTAVPPTSTPTPLLAAPVQPGETHPDEPVFISGDIPYTFPLFKNSIAQPFVMLEDEAGFVRRDREFQFNLAGQAIGPVVVHEDETLTYMLSLPSVPQGTFVDVDNDDQSDAGVQVFAIAYWSNTWNDPFLERRDGKGWSATYTSAIVDTERENEIVGGILVVWAPDDGQEFPSGFGPDGKLFTADDPLAAVLPGYSLVDLNQEPFRVYKEAQPVLTLNEGAIQVDDYSTVDYAEAFQSLFAKVSREYPFTQEKNVDWAALESEFVPRFEEARDYPDYYTALRDFTLSIPDAHIGLTFDNGLFNELAGGGMGLQLAELSDGRLVVVKALPGLPGAEAGMQPGAEITSWNGASPAQAIAQVVPYFGPFSTEHTRRIAQVNFLSRMPVDSEVTVAFKNPGDTQEQEVTLRAAAEVDSFFLTYTGFGQDELALPIEASMLDESGLGYLRINTFSDDYSLMASLWGRAIQGLVDAEAPGLIIDLRDNSGGNMDLAKEFAAYFFDEEMEFYDTLYYNENSGQFESRGHPLRIVPAPLYFDKPIAVLVSPNCVSACEGFSYILQHDGRAKVVGHYPSAGAFGEVGAGQYKMPDEISMQFPTGRSVTPEGEVIIEGRGVVPDVLVPVTLESALGQVDAVLQAAVEALQ